MQSHLFPEAILATPGRVSGLFPCSHTVKKVDNSAVVLKVPIATFLSEIRSLLLMGELPGGRDLFVVITVSLGEVSHSLSTALLTPEVTLTTLHVSFLSLQSCLNGCRAILGRIEVRWCEELNSFTVTFSERFLSGGDSDRC